MNLRQFLIEQPHQFVVLLDGFEWLDEDRLPARTRAVHHTLHAAFLLDFHRDYKTLAANGYEFFLHRAALGQPAQISAQRFLNGAPLLFDLAADARQLRRGLVFQSSIGLDFVAEETQKFGEVDNLLRERAYSAPVGLHIRGRMQRNLAPLGRAVDQQNHVANFGGFQRGARNARFLHLPIDFTQAGKIEAAADAPELANLARQFLLSLNPMAIGGRSESGDPLLSKGRGGVSVQHFPERVKLQHPRRIVSERLRHCISWYRSRGARSAESKKERNEPEV